MQATEVIAAGIDIIVELYVLYATMTTKVLTVVVNVR